MREEMRKAAQCLLSMQRQSWEQGCAMQAMLELGEMETVIRLAYESVYRSVPDGRCAVLTTTHAVTDPCCVGEALIAAWKATGDEFLKAGLDKLLVWALEKAPRNGAGVVYHVEEASQFWVDSMYMLPPFLAAAGYYDEALTNFYGYYEALHDEKTGLMRHMWDDEKKAFVRDALWATGNGWTLAAMARLIDLLPDERAKDREEIIRRTKALLEAAMPWMREDGLFHDVLDDKTSFVEVNFPQMMAYTIFRGVKSGWLEESWLDAAYRMRKAANGKMNAYGFVRDVCGAPYFDKPGISPEGQAFYLLMECAAQKCENR
ncbi:MAG: glycoside hydrolase family 88 protein [Lachnospiraceae bacterium]|nr:glycoside hydrolase family 88 protein [Lachnospiraceae bacterium]